MKKRLFIVFAFVIFLIGVTYAWWRWQSSNNTDVSFTIDGITVTYSAGPDISGVKLIPVTTLQKGLNDGTAIEKTITVSSNQRAKLNLYLDVEILDNGLKQSYVVYQLRKGSEVVANGNFANTNVGDTITLLTNAKIGSSNSVYKLYIWIDGSVPNSMDVFNQNYKFVLRATASSTNQGNSALPDFILDSNAPLDSVNSTYVTGETTYSLSSEDETTLKAYMVNEMSMTSEDADSCIADDYYDGCLEESVYDYNYENDPDIELIETNIPGIDFTQPSSDTNGKGLYIRSGTENNTNPIYYYRGAVDDNNVYFGGFCWKIVRTTDTGGLKMIYNGTATTEGTCTKEAGSGSIGSNPSPKASKNDKVIPSLLDNRTTEPYMKLLSISSGNSLIGTIAFNTNYNDAKYVGYTYDNSGVETDSTIKQEIDDWYEEYLLTNYDNYIEDTVYCNDREEATVAEVTQLENLGYTTTGATYYKPTIRFSVTEIPSLECTNNTDKYTKSASIGNGKLTYPIGLLTMDEIWLAGEDNDYETSANTTNYLYNNSYWWSLSPYRFFDGNASVWTARPGDGLYFDDVVNSGYGARPAISLKPGQNFEYGNGSGANPYRFVATVPAGDNDNGSGSSSGRGIK